MKSVDLLSNQYDALRANSVNGIDIAAMQRETIRYDDQFIHETDLIAQILQLTCE